MPNYYDRFTQDKRWDKLLFIANRGLQASEMNELQTVLNDKIRKLSNVLMSDGSVVTGCDIIVPSSYPSSSVKIAPGLIYMEGSIVTVTEQTVLGSFTGNGIEYIYVRVSETIQTELDDAELSDPALESLNYNKTGSHRRLLTVTFSSAAHKQSDSVEFGYIYDGAVLFKPSAIGTDKILEVLEKRTKDVSGDFFVDGAELQLSTNELDSTKYDIYIDTYNAYVEGRNYESDSTQIRTVDKAIATREVQDSIVIANAFDTLSPNIDNVFRLEENYVDFVHLCAYPVEVTITLTKGSAGGTDEIPLDDILAIVLVKDGGTTYTTPTDFLFTGGDTLDWSPAGSEPSPGGTYDVTLRRMKQATASGVYNTNEYYVTYPLGDTGNYVDAELTITDPDYYWGNSSYIVNPEYTVFRFRIDAIVLNQSLGFVEVIEGEYSDFQPAPLPALNADQPLLYLISLDPGDYYDPNFYDITDKRVFRITQKGLRVMEDQVRANQENLTFTQLDQDAASMPVGGAMSGIFTESFETIDEVDIGYEGGTGPGNAGSFFAEDFTSAIDDGALVLSADMNDNRLDPVVSSSGFQANETNYTLPYTNVTLIEQPIASSFVSVNPYAIPYAEALVKITPARDIWIDRETVNVLHRDKAVTNVVTQRVTAKPMVIPARVSCDAWTRRGRFCGFWYNRLRQEGANVRRWPLSFWWKRRIGLTTRWRTTFQTTVRDQNLGTTNEVFSVNTQNSTIRYCRQRTISCEGESFIVPGNVNDYRLEATLGGITIPNFNSTVGPLLSDYTFSGSFTVPAGIPVGVQPLVIKVIQIVSGTTVLEGETNYFAKGTLSVTTRNLRPVTTIRRTITRTPVMQLQIDVVGRRWIDPVAQSFLFEEDNFITKVGIYFAGRGTGPEGVTCELVTMENGYPSQNVIASTYLSYVNVATSNDSSAETIFTFEDPVHIASNTEFAVVLRSADDAFLIWYARQGEIDKLTERKIISQPHAGVFFKSQNASTWTADQSADMKIKLYRAEFTLAEKTLIFATQNLKLDISDIGQSWMMLAADLKETPDTSAKFYFQTNYMQAGSTWEPVNISERTQLLSSDDIAGGNLATSNTVKVVMSTNNTRVSPILDKAIGTSYWKYYQTGHYYSRWLDFGAESLFDMAKIRIFAMDLGIPWRISVIVSYDNLTWYEYDSLTDNDTHPPADGKVSRVIKEIDTNENIGAYLYEFLFNFKDNFTSPGLARYMKIHIQLGDGTHDQLDTPMLFDLRTAVYEDI